MVQHNGVFTTIAIYEMVYRCKCVGVDKNGTRVSDEVTLGRLLSERVK